MSWGERVNFIDLNVAKFISEEGIDQVKARKLLAKMLPFSRNTINNVLKEKMIHGNVLGGSSPRSRLRRFDMLSDEQKEQIRKLVVLFLVTDLCRLIYICHFIKI